MPQDWISEAISRFIGALELGQEGARARAEYAPFRGQEPDAPPARESGSEVIRLSAPHELKAFDPAISWQGVAPEILPLPFGWSGEPLALSPLQLVAPRLTIGLGRLPEAGGSVQGGMGWAQMLPPQLAVVTQQRIWLDDDDDLIWGDGSTLFDRALLHQAWEGLIAKAQALSLSHQLMAPEMGGAGFVGAGLAGVETMFLSPEQSLGWMLALRDLADGSSGDAVLSHVFAAPVMAPVAGADGGAVAADGPQKVIMVNGQIAAEMAVLQDLLSPAWLKTLGFGAEDGADADTDADTDAETGAGQSGLETSGESQSHSSSHSHSSSNAFDGGFSAGGGGSAGGGHHPDPDPDPWQGLPRLPDPPPAGHQITSGGNLLSNEAVIVTNGPDAALIALGGDLIRLDLISQIGLLFGGESGALLRGEGIAQIGAAVLASDQPEGYLADLLINTARLDKGFLGLQEAGSAGAGFAPMGAMALPREVQLTKLEGDLIFVNHLQQHIFASDFDRIELVLSAASSQISLGGNLLFNAMSLQALSSHYDLILIGQNMIQMNVIEQISVLYDSDYLDGWGQAGRESGGNLLFNSASIAYGAMDQAHDLSAGLRADLAALGAGGDLRLSSLQDPVFAGHQALSVLYVSGDLIEQNIIQQTSYLGDGDQLVLLQDQIRAEIFAAGLSLESGGNLLINAAAIVDLGVQSQIMVGGQTYSDAVIYQAGLLEQAAPPSGVKLAADPDPLAQLGLGSGDLAPAAVAFLSGDLQEGGWGDGGGMGQVAGQAFGQAFGQVAGQAAASVGAGASPYGSAWPPLGASPADGLQAVLS